MTEILENQTKLKTTHTRPSCAVYFVDKSWRLQETFAASAGLIIPEIEDIINVRTNISRSAVGTFSLTLSNNGGKYLVNDNIEESVQTIKSNFDERASNEVPQTSVERPQIHESIYPHTSAKDWLQQENVNDIITVTEPVTDKNGKTVLENRQYLVTLERNKETGKSEWVYYKAGDRNDNFKRTAAPVEFSNDNLRKRRYNQDFYTLYGGSLKRTKPIFEPMQRVIILMSSRFSSSPRKMLTVFTGLVDSVVDDYSEGKETLTITGRDVLKWLDISQININPAIISGRLPESGAENLQIFENTFAGKQGWEIISYLIFGGDLDTPGTRNIKAVGDFEIRTFADAGTAGAAGVYSGANTKTTVVRVGQEKYLVGSKEITVDSVSELFKHSTVYLQVQNVDKQITSDGKEISSPIRKYLNSFTNYQALSDYRGRLEICREVAGWANYEFYADANGDIYFHQPRFSNHWITNAENAEAFVIKEEDVISCSFSDSDEAVYTSVLVTGQVDYIQGPVFQEYEYRHLEEEQTLISKYGRRFIGVTSPYLHSNLDCKAYAKTILQRRNAERRTGTITIPLRPELKIAYPIYISYKNDIYYVNSIDHNFQWGGQATTEISLTYGRKPWEILPEVLDYGSTAVMLDQSPPATPEEISSRSISGENFSVAPEDKFTIGPLVSGVYRVSQLFSNIHAGVDLVDKSNGFAQVFAVKDGIVLYSGNDSGGHYTITISHNDTLQTTYTHLTPASILVSLHQHVIAGIPIGIVNFGIEPGVTGPHLHFEVKRRLKGSFQEVDPAPYLPDGYLNQAR